MAGFICIPCQCAVTPKRVKRGSGKTEFAAWMVFPLGLPYTIWRMLSKQNSCPHCGNDMLVADTSVMGMRILQLADGVTPQPDKRVLLAKRVAQYQREEGKALEAEPEIKREERHAPEPVKVSAPVAIPNPLPISSEPRGRPLDEEW